MSETKGKSEDEKNNSELTEETQCKLQNSITIETLQWFETVERNR